MDMEAPSMESTQLTLSKTEVSNLVTDIWRILKRAQRDAATPESVKIACERAMERADLLGFEIQEMIGEAYHTNMNVRVVHQEGSPTNLRISECLSPAVYFTPAQSEQKQLIKRAEVVIQGEA